MNAKTLALLLLCGSSFACDLLGPGPSDDSAGDADSGTPDPDGGDAPSNDDDPTDGGTTGGGGLDTSGGGLDTSGGMESGGAPPADVPAQLVGSWYAGDGESSLATLDVYTDGTYAEDIQGKQQDGGCLVSIDQQISGEYGVDGDVLTLHPTTAHLFVDECGDAAESDELPPDSVLTYQLSADEWGYTLRLTPQGGEWADSILYHRL